MRNLLKITILFVATGCAHYQVGDNSQINVGVQTIEIPADYDVDAGVLTNFLVDRLGARGFEATWRSDAQLRCSVDPSRVDGFGTAAAPTARLTCEIGEEKIEQFATTGSSVGSEYRISTRSILVTEATQNAIIDAMPKIERAIRRNYGQR